MTATTLKEMFGDVFQNGAGNSVFMPRPTAEFTPGADTRYVFELDDIRLLLMWDSQKVSYNKNLMITGPTGSGKTQLIFQFAARTGREVFRYSCHERTDFSDLLGTMIINADGSTGFQDGPLTMAMKRGGIFLLDEVNAARPGTLIGMNGVLDGAESITIPGSTQIVKRHPEFRVAMTGNALTRDDSASSFGGIQRMNVAFMDRAFIIEKGYLPEIVEAKALQEYLEGAVQDPNLNPGGTVVPVGMTVTIVKFANSIREQFMRGECDLTVSTRGLFAFAEMMAMRWSAMEKNATKEMRFCAKATLLGKAAEPMQTSLLKTFDVTVGDKVRFGGAKANPAQPSAQAKANRVTFLINPDRQGGGEMAVWGYLVKEGGVCEMFNGSLTGNATRITKSADKTMGMAQTEANTKASQRGYTIAAAFEMVGGYGELETRYPAIVAAFKANKAQFQATNVGQTRLAKLAETTLKAAMPGVVVY